MAAWLPGPQWARTSYGMKHLFDGCAMLVKVSFEGRYASVQQRQAASYSVLDAASALQGRGVRCSCTRHAMRRVGA